MVLCVSCTRAQAPAAGAVTVVFRHQPLWADPAAFQAFLERFQRENSDVQVRAETLPNGSDIAREMFVAALEGGADDFDVFAIDVIWAPEFARAGWLADLSAAFPPQRLSRELPAAAQAATLDGRTFAVPWFVDVGLLYYRADLVPRPPRTYAELRELALAAMKERPGISGFLWQGRQYEGLDCNFFEAAWGHGAQVEKDGRIAVRSGAAEAGLGWLRQTIVDGLSPRSVLSSGGGDAPHLPGRARRLPAELAVRLGAGAGGGFAGARQGGLRFPAVGGRPAGIGRSRRLASGGECARPSAAKARRGAADCVLTSQEAETALAVDYSRLPARRSVYDDPRLRERAPFIAALLPIALAARPRPVTPWYALASDDLQGELSAAVAGLRTPEEALSRAQRFVEHLEEQ